MPKNGLFINKHYGIQCICMPRFIVSTVGIAFLKCANLETLEYYLHVVIWIFLLIGHIRILSIGNGRSFRGVSLETDN